MEYHDKMCEFLLDINFKSLKEISNFFLMDLTWSGFKLVFIQLIRKVGGNKKAFKKDENLYIHIILLK